MSAVLSNMILAVLFGLGCSTYFGYFALVARMALAIQRKQTAPNAGRVRTVSSPASSRHC